MAKEEHQSEGGEEQGYSQSIRNINDCGWEIRRVLGFIKDITVFL